MGILIAVVCIAGVLGWVIVKNDELAGLGRAVRPGSFRSPHGRLVHVKPLGQLPAEERWSRRFTRSFPLVSCIAVFACALISVGLLQSVPLGAIGATIQGVLNTPLPAAIITAEALLRSHGGKRLLPTYIIALFGALLMQGIVLGAFAALGWLASFVADGLGPAISWVGVLFSSPFAFALGAALVVARTGSMVKFRRRFADGSENEIEVSSNSVAYGAFCELMDEKAAARGATRSSGKADKGAAGGFASGNDAGGTATSDNGYGTATDEGSNGKTADNDKAAE